MYAQTLGQVFTHEMKPYEVELLVAEVGRTDDDHAEMYHLFYDGVVIDERRYAVLGGQTEQITEALETQYADGMELGDALEARGTRARLRRRVTRRRLARGRAARTGPAPPRVPADQESAELTDVCSASDPATAAAQYQRSTCATGPATSTNRISAGDDAPARVAAGARRRPIVVEALVDLVDLGDEQHHARLFDLIAGHVHVDPREITDRQAVRTVERAAQLHVETLVEEPGGQHVRPKRSLERCESAHRDHGASV